MNRFRTTAASLTLASLIAHANRGLAEEAPSTPSIEPDTNGPDDTNDRPPTIGLSAATVEKRLDALAANPVPEGLAMGAMCYEMVPLADQTTYVCPTCNASTVYTKTSNESALATIYFAQAELETCRQLAASFSTISVTIDESLLCQSCTPDQDERHPVLVVRLPDHEPARTWPFDAEDLRLLRELLDGSDIHRDDYDFETPLKHHLPRLRLLLGLPEGEALP